STALAPMSAAIVGRGLPPVPAPDVRTRLPALPALSRQVPPRSGRLRVASTCTGVAPGDETIVRPKPIDPSGFEKAVPIADARSFDPHWSSVPSTEYTAPFCVTATVMTLQ